MHVQSFTVNPFAENTYVCHDHGEAVLIDPGCFTPEEYERVQDYIEEKNLEIKHLLLTHGHIDHVIGCAFFAEHFGQGFQMHRADEPLLARAVVQGAQFGVRIPEPPPPHAFLDEGDQIQFGTVTWDILHCPGHSPGSICFVDHANGVVIGGDVLFRGSIGRTDLWQGSMPVLLGAIRDKLLPLPDKTLVYSGHGPVTTIGEERAANPFLQDL